jgi:hypothetical protein
VFAPFRVPRSVTRSPKPMLRRGRLYSRIQGGQTWEIGRLLAEATLLLTSDL